MKCDFHIHTSYSYDSFASPQKMVETAIARGLDCIAITDHGNMKGAIEALHFAFDKPILIVPGIEVKSKDGDILALNVKRIIPDKLSSRETIARIKEQGMAVLAHPYGFFTSAFKGDLNEIKDEVDGMEIYNASIIGNGNQKAFDFVKKNNLAFTVGTDSHSPNFIGRAWLEIPGENLSIEQVLEEVRKKTGTVHHKPVSFLEKVEDHSRRNLAKIIK